MTVDRIKYFLKKQLLMLHDSVKFKRMIPKKNGEGFWLPTILDGSREVFYSFTKDLELGHSWYYNRENILL
jgi:hypothetical protein